MSLGFCLLHVQYEGHFAVHESTQTQFTLAKQQQDCGRLAAFNRQCCCVCRGGNAVEPSARHIFLLNCLAAISSVTAEQDCCQGKHVNLIQDIQHHLRELVNSEASQVLQQCGFKAHLQYDRYPCHPQVPIP